MHLQIVNTYVKVYSKVMKWSENALRKIVVNNFLKNNYSKIGLKK